MNSSPQINELAAALAKAQAQIKNAIKDSANPFFDSTYADLAEVWAVARDPLTSNGLSVVQLPSNDGDKISVETVLMHSSGQWISSVLAVKPMKADAQSAGGVITYLRRYMLAAIAGITQADDDGNLATKGRSAPEKRAPAAEDHNQDNQDEGGEAFDPTNESHKKKLRQALLNRQITGQAAFKVFDAMKGRFPSDLDEVINSVLPPR